MPVTIGLQTPTLFKPTEVGLPLVEKATVDSKQSIDATTVGNKVDTQVLNAVSGVKARIEGLSNRELAQYLDTSQFSEVDSETMMNVFLAAVAHQEEDGPAVVRDLLTFDPSSWEKHVGVLIAAIVAVNIARESSAKMSGIFAQLAYDSAKEQGRSIIRAGESVMYSAVVGAIVTGGLTVGGAALSIKGHGQRHTDIKTNQADARKFDAKAAQARQDLKAFDQAKMASGPKTARGANADGDNTVLTAQKDAQHLSPEERSSLEAVLKKSLASAKDSRLQSQLAQKTIEGNIIKGNALMGVGGSLSAGLSAILRLGESAYRNDEVNRQAEQGINRGVSDAANQGISEDASLLMKLLEIFQQVLDGRNAASGTIASARV
ncbi:invasin protein C (IpaC_SipC) [Pseudomonas sp. LAMO17WK12:I10]|uniref:IpaC/SipC family type III secretion system effector n=1 Tax=unclassified Pseudomonas TaxID=196821 RepID=UPI000BCD815D|nr:MULTISPECIES: IpaC/SipC family type III secretion system effector [unclassified Pseudomonas]PXX53993.1 IpaC/SipC-like invasin protein C [Pseudomonas sp. LAMO17WK12:I9]SNY51908.1 invasin protein C (IpaC_SipC) [Pseudomonas sp. LAMO17WK12:I10]